MSIIYKNSTDTTICANIRGVYCGGMYVTCHSAYPPPSSLQIYNTGLEYNLIRGVWPTMALEAGVCLFVAV